MFEPDSKAKNSAGELLLLVGAESPLNFHHYHYRFHHHHYNSSLIPWLPSSSHKTTWCLNKDSQVGWQNTGSLKQMLKANKSKINKPSHAKPDYCQMYQFHSQSNRPAPTAAPAATASKDTAGSFEKNLEISNERFFIFLPCSRSFYFLAKPWLLYKTAKVPY